MLIQLVAILDHISVIVGIADAHKARAHDVDIVVTVADIKRADAAIGLHGPTERSVLFRLGNDAQNARHEVIIRKACLDHGCRGLIEIRKRADHHYLDAALVKERDVGIGVCDGKSRLGSSPSTVLPSAMVTFTK